MDVSAGLVRLGHARSSELAVRARLYGDTERRRVRGHAGSVVAQREHAEPGMKVVLSQINFIPGFRVDDECHIHGGVAGTR